MSDTTDDMDCGYDGECIYCGDWICDGDCTPFNNRMKLMRRKIKMEQIKKPIYVVSALSRSSSLIGELKKFDNEKEATEHAKYVIARRAQENKPYLAFFVLKTVVIVETKTPPVTVRKLSK